MARRRFETDKQYDNRTTTRSGERPYDTYVALLSQTNSEDPSAQVLENTLPGDITWTRQAAGNYTGTLSSGFPMDKTVLFATMGENLGDAIIVLFYRQDASRVKLLAYGTSGDAFLVDLSSTISIEIRVYS